MAALKWIHLDNLCSNKEVIESGGISEKPLLFSVALDESGKICMMRASTNYVNEDRLMILAPKDIIKKERSTSIDMNLQTYYSLDKCPIEVRMLVFKSNGSKNSTDVKSYWEEMYLQHKDKESLQNGIDINVKLCNAIGVTPEITSIKELDLDGV